MQLSGILFWSSESRPVLHLQNCCKFTWKECLYFNEFPCTRCSYKLQYSWQLFMLYTVAFCWQSWRDICEETAIRSGEGCQWFWTRGASERSTTCTQMFFNETGMNKKIHFPFPAHQLLGVLWYRYALCDMLVIINWCFLSIHSTSWTKKKAN
jgi:hypothetical protein